LEGGWPPTSWIQVAKTYAAVVAAQTVIDQLEEVNERQGEGEGLMETQKCAIIASSALLRDDLEVVQVRDGSLELVIVGTAPTIIHWLGTIQPIITAVSTTISAVQLGRKLIGRLKSNPSKPDLAWIATLPAGSEVSVTTESGITTVRVGPLQ
jgi:hypothetical protein